MLEIQFHTQQEGTGMRIIVVTNLNTGCQAAQFHLWVCTFVTRNREEIVAGRIEREIGNPISNLSQIVGEGERGKPQVTAIFQITIGGVLGIHIAILLVGQGLLQDILSLRDQVDRVVLCTECVEDLVADGSLEEQVERPFFPVQRVVPAVGQFGLCTSCLRLVCLFGRGGCFTCAFACRRIMYIELRDPMLVVTGPSRCCVLPLHGC